MKTPKQQAKTTDIILLWCNLSEWFPTCCTLLTV